MKPRSRRRTVLLLIVAALVATGVGALVKATHALTDVELSTVDTRFDIRGAQDPRTDVVIVGMDERTLRADADPVIPFNRRRHARVIRQLTKAGARVIAYDVQFTEPSDFPGADDALVEAVHDAPRTVLGTTDVSADGGTNIFGGGEGLEYAGATPASSIVPNDADGALRHLPNSHQGLESFGVAAARLHTGRAVRAPRGSSWIDYVGPTGTIPRLSFGDVERGQFDASDVRGKVAVVGATARALKDLHRTSTSGAMPGPEVQANIVATALAGFPIHDAASWIDWLALVALAAVGPLVAVRFGTAAGAVAALVAVPIFLAAAQLAFNEGAIVSIVPPLCAAVTGVFATILVAVPASHPVVNRMLDRISAGGGNTRTRRLRAVLLLVAALVVVGAGLLAEATNALKGAELSTVDTRFSVRGAVAPPPQVVVVGIDSKTFNTDPKPTWPFNRRLHARVIRNLHRAGAKVIAYDVVFADPSNDPVADDRLVEAARQARPMVMTATDVNEAGETNVFGGKAAQDYSHVIPAHAIAPKDSDGRVRRMLYSYQGLATFAMASAGTFLGRRPPPGPPESDAWTDFAGPEGTIPRLSFVDVERGTFPASAVRGKVVVVGATDTSLQDQHETSTTGSALMYGAEVQANYIGTILKGFPLRSAQWWINALLVVVLGMCAPLAALRMRMAFAVATGLAAIVALLVGAQLAFDAGTIVTVIYPLVAGVVALAATAAIHGVTVAFERANTRDAFARFVPESVVDQVLADADGLRLGGVRGEATVMFSDLRGFTSFAETLEPEQVIAALNLYLTAMSEAILDHGGTLVAYMGDGIMAVFGAPLHQEDHADRALAAARDMLDRLVGFNDALRQDSLHEGFKMGIGLNSGPVMSGNVGSERRLEYTALGDTTNTAARLEGMTKGTPYQLYVADTTRAALQRPADDLVSVGEFEVRGRKAKIKLWSLAEVAEAEGDSPPAPAERDTEAEGDRPPAPATVTEAEGDSPPEPATVTEGS